MTLVLSDEVDISRGDLLVDAQETLMPVQSAEVDVVWMAEQPLKVGSSYQIKVAGKQARATVDRIIHQVNINTLETSDTDQLPLNGIGRVVLTFDEPMVIDIYQENPVTGGLIFIDRLSNVTVGAGMVSALVAEETVSGDSQYGAFELELNALIRKHFPHWGARDLTGGR